MAKRFITYHHLDMSGIDGENELVARQFLTLVRYLMGKQQQERKFMIPNNDKFMYLSFARESNEIIDLLFVSAKHSYRAPLIDSVNLASRPNPKTMTEGEQVKTHMVVKLNGDDVILLLESGGQCLKLSIILKYLNHFVTIFMRETQNDMDMFSGSIIAREDFLEVLNDMDRVLSAEITMKKQVLGDDFLNLSGRIDEVVDNVKIKIAAKRNRSIKEIVRDSLACINGNRREIVSMRVKGKMPNNEESLISTDVIIKKDYVDVERDESTGEFVSEMMFREMERLVNQL